MGRFVLSAFADEISADFEKQLEGLNRLGIRYIELRGIDGKNVADHTLDEIDTVYRRLQAKGIAVSAVGSPIGKVDVREPFEPHMEKFLHVVKLAQHLHAPYIRLFSFFIPEGEDPAPYKDTVIERLQAMAEANRGSGVRLLHENERYIYGDIPERCREILEALGPDRMEATYDPANFVHCNVENMPRAYETMRPYVRYLHMKDAVYRTEQKRTLDMGFENIGDVHRVPGEGDGQLREVLSAFNDSGYDGFLTLEPHLSADPSVDGFEKFEIAHRAITGILKDLGARIE